MPARVKALRRARRGADAEDLPDPRVQGPCDASPVHHLDRCRGALPRAGRHRGAGRDLDVLVLRRGMPQGPGRLHRRVRRVVAFGDRLHGVPHAGGGRPHHLRAAQDEGSRRALPDRHEQVRAAAESSRPRLRVRGDEVQAVRSVPQPGAPQGDAGQGHHHRPQGARGGRGRRSARRGVRSRDLVHVVPQPHRSQRGRGAAHPQAPDLGRRDQASCELHEDDGLLPLPHPHRQVVQRTVEGARRVRQVPSQGTSS